ncbi:MAG TPA: IS1 family transposase [Acidobacteriaceae bacterium]|nr:IS1 family transposase [Acidobacteriaceae bacterium]
MMSEAKTDISMVCGFCQIECQRFGKHRNGLRRFRCPNCKKTYTEQHSRMLGTMYISPEKTELAIKLLVEGNSIRSTERISGLDRNTILSLLVKAGERCRRVMQQKIEYLDVKNVEVDEIWGYCFKKQGRVRPDESRAQIGDAWCYVGIERTSKLVLAFHLGRRSRVDTEAFLNKLRYATSDRTFQLSTDGFQAYPAAVGLTLQDRVDYAQIIKVYGSPREGEQRYSPAEVISVDYVPVMGDPDIRRVCTSHIERQNLTIRMGMRRMTRLTNAFSKKWENLEAAYALHFAYYNFCRVHKTLRVTPAMEQGITDHIWTIAELIA